MARVLCMTEFLDKDPARPSSSRSRSNFFIWVTAQGIDNEVKIIGKSIFSKVKVKVAVNIKVVVVSVEIKELVSGSRSLFSRSRSRTRSPSSGPRRQHRDHVPSSSTATASRSHSREHRPRPGIESPSTAARDQCCVAVDTGYSRVHHLSMASGGVASRLAPRDDNPDCSPVFYAGGFGHPVIESDIREPGHQPCVTLHLCSRSLKVSRNDTFE